MKSSNSEIEQYYFEKFQTQYDLPIGDVIYSDKPDVIIRADKKLGIEITNFYTDPTGREQSQISMRLNAAKKAQKAYQEKAKKSIEYTFGFNRQNPIQNVTKMTKSLTLLAERFENREIGQIEKSAFSDIPEVAFVWRGGEYLDCEWRVSQAFTIPLMDKIRLAEIIKEKGQKAKDYAFCDELWLLIVVNFIDLAQDQEIMNVQLDEIKTSVFDRVILYKTGMEQIREVPLKSSKAD